MRAALIALFVAWALPALADNVNMDAATGYRIQNYRSPVNLPIEGGTQVDVAAVDRLMKQGAIMVDVMPARVGYDKKTGKWLLAEKRDDIPGSTWLPNTGHGKLEPRLAAYFANSLARLAGGSLEKPVVFYCMADCWMSWNAVKRAAGLGYKQVYWFADGTDGWSESGRDLVEATPPVVPPLP